MTDMNVQKANANSFFGKNLTFKNLFKVVLHSVLNGFSY